MISDYSSVEFGAYLKETVFGDCIHNNLLGSFSYQCSSLPNSGIVFNTASLYDSNATALNSTTGPRS